MSYHQEVASSTVRTLEYLINKHCLRQETVPVKVKREVLASIPRAKPRKPHTCVRMTPDLHDRIYAECEVYMPESVVDALARRHGVSMSTVWKVRSKRHSMYDRIRSEKARIKHVMSLVGQ
jgi:hypothetical protein